MTDLYLDIRFAEASSFGLCNDESFINREVWRTILLYRNKSMELSALWTEAYLASSPVLVLCSWVSASTTIRDGLRGHGFPLSAASNRPRLAALSSASEVQPELIYHLFSVV